MPCHFFEVVSLHEDPNWTSDNHADNAEQRGCEGSRS